jgi:hypothetical protein
MIKNITEHISPHRGLPMENGFYIYAIPLGLKKMKKNKKLTEPDKMSLYVCTEKEFKN